MIERYQFGTMVVNGKEYHSDLMICGERIWDSWWRREGHSICIEDLENLLNENPKSVVIGTGSAGFMRVPRETAAELEARGIRVIAQITDRAWRTFNDLQAREKVAGAFHLTC